MAAMLENRISRSRGGWSGVLALTLCVSTLIASEFMPVSLLTPIAADLHVTGGQAGQAIAVSGIFAKETGYGFAFTIAQDPVTALTTATTPQELDIDAALEKDVQDDRVAKNGGKGKRPSHLQIIK
jgi:hypothetical protein